MSAAAAQRNDVARRVRVITIPVAVFIPVFTARHHSQRRASAAVLATVPHAAAAAADFSFSLRLGILSALDAQASYRISRHQTQRGAAASIFASIPNASGAAHHA